VHKQEFKELYQVALKPTPGKFTRFRDVPSPCPIERILDTSTDKSAVKPLGTYRPPHARLTPPAGTSSPVDGSSKNTSNGVGAIVKLSKPVTALTEIEKKIRTLEKKFRQIQDLKKRQSDGEKLEANQVDKINSEEKLLLEMQQLKL